MIQFLSVIVDDDESGNSGTNNDNLQFFRLLFTICTLGFFICITIFGYIDGKFFRRNEIFSIGSTMSAATYTLDIISGLI